MRRTLGADCEPVVGQLSHWPFVKPILGVSNSWGVDIVFDLTVVWQDQANYVASISSSTILLEWERRG